MTDSLAHALERATAERDALYRALARLVVERKGNEFTTPQQQDSLRHARRLLAEIKSPVEAP